VQIKETRETLLRLLDNQHDMLDLLVTKKQGLGATFEGNQASEQVCQQQVKLSEARKACQQQVKHVSSK
jgi:hypothetical protein